MVKFGKIVTVIGVILLILSPLLTSVTYKAALAVISIGLYIFSIDLGGGRREMVRNLDKDNKQGKEARISYISIIVATILLYIAVI